MIPHDKTLVPIITPQLKPTLNLSPVKNSLSNVPPLKNSPTQFPPINPHAIQLPIKNTPKLEAFVINPQIQVPPNKTPPIPVKPIKNSPFKVPTVKNPQTRAPSIKNPPTRVQPIIYPKGPPPNPDLCSYMQKKKRHPDWSVSLLGDQPPSKSYKKCCQSVRQEDDSCQLLMCKETLPDLLPRESSIKRRHDVVRYYLIYFNM